MSDTVVITGLGIVCPLGSRIPTIWKALVSGQTHHIRRRYWLNSDAPPVGRVPSFQKRRHLDRRRRRFVTREVVLGVAAVRSAIVMARCADLLSSSRTGLFVGAPLNLGEAGDMGESLCDSVDDQGRFDAVAFARGGAPHINPLSLIRALSNGLACQLTIEYEMRGFNTNIASGGTSSTLAIDAALRGILHGRFDRALVVGYDGLDGALSHGYTDRRRQADPALAPFVHPTLGAFPSEGSSALVLERGSHAAKRGVRPRAEIVATGHGRSSDPTKNPARGFENALSQALEGSGLSALPDVIHFDGWGGRRHWEAATDALERLSRHASRTALTSTIASTGWAPAASGAMGTAIATLGQQASLVPPTAGTLGRARVPRSVVRRPLRLRIRSSAVLTSDATGNCCALVLRNCSPERKDTCST